MIVEKRKRIRKLKPIETDWIPEPNFVEIEQWNDIRLPNIRPKSILLLKAILAGVIGYLLGDFFFLD